jgi:hypothetical protein
MFADLGAPRDVDWRGRQVIRTCARPASPEEVSGNSGAVHQPSALRDDHDEVGGKGLTPAGADRQGHLEMRVDIHAAWGAPVATADTARTVDFANVSTDGLESSPHAGALAGLRAHEARYFKNKYGLDFTVRPASEAAETIDWVHRILERERGIVISSPPLEATEVPVDNIRWPYVFYASGLSVTTDHAGKLRLFVSRT